MEQRLWK